MEEESYTSTHPLDHTGPVTGSLYLKVCIVAVKEEGRGTGGGGDKIGQKNRAY